MKRPWNKQAWALVALGLAVAALLVGALWRRPAAAPANGAAPPAGASPAGGKARRRASAAQDNRSGSIAGRVTEPGGAPVTGAQVCAVVETGAKLGAMVALGAPPPVCAPAAADGQYTLSGLRPARFTITASAPGHRPAHYRAPDVFRTPFLELAAGEARTGVDVVLPAGGVEVRGKVEDIGGGAVSGALITLFARPDAADVVLARSDAQGLYAAWVDEGHYMARASADGYADAFKDGMAPGPALELLLTPASAIVGRVVEAGTGAPVEGASITLGDSEAWGVAPFVTVARSDAEGRFRVDRLTPGRYKVTARALGQVGQSRESVHLGVGQTSREVLIEVHPAPVVAGRVEVAPGGAPCPSGTVRLMGPAQGEMPSAVIEPDGEVLFAGVLRGSYQVFVACENHVAEQTYPAVVVGEVDVEGLVWPVRAGLSIRGRVVDRDDNPVRASVQAIAHELMGEGPAPGAFSSTETDDGGFVLSGLLPARYTVTARPVHHTEPEAVEVEVRDDHAPEVKLVVDRGGGIEGTVTDQDDRPVAGVDIMIQGPQRGAMVRSLDDGSFSQGGLPPGEYRVVASEEHQRGMGMVPAPGQPPGPLPGVPATVKAGASTRVALVVGRRSGVIQGRVVDEIGEPVADVFVRAEPEAEGGPPGVPGGGHMARAPWGAFGRAPVLTDSDGRFVLGNLQEATYTVHAYRTGGGDASAEHVKLGDDVTLTLKPAGGISGTLSVPSGKVPDQFTVGVMSRTSMFFRSETFVLTGGAFSLSDLPEGEYEVSTDVEEGMASVNVALGPGEQRGGVVLAIVPHASVRGQVVSLDGGAPIAGVRLHVSPRKMIPRPMMRPGTGQDNVTDEAGRFEVRQVPAGPIMLVCMPSDGMKSPYDVAAVPVEVQAGGVTDAGQIVMAKRRVGPGDPPGDLGFAMKGPAMGFGVGADLAEQHIEVGELRPQGPAELAGLRVGDVIVSVDGHDVRGKQGYLYGTLSTVPAGTQVTLGLARGASVAITADKMPMPHGVGPVPPRPGGG